MDELLVKEVLALAWNIAPNVPTWNNKIAHCNSFLNKAIHRVLLGCQYQRQTQRL
jgi:hypothetical protein